ncbi:MAG TPA: flagellar assembly peptidoglycan hydrolase FlgJ [Aquabacterium sp.]|jgi:flagellar protein FlgJ|uniref:flagellar assembly peptidoglycan hydrolase FlgJ n=1 Tax=Aquabacterium sp. TaxID=1872578 RepID=UPI002E30ECD4|nr:flagellar assembly peptidoglycan hydrolase FlgJ [Aquabacterium sp.]HEX5372704.1 flagellar assembly peptidoglycan hydrolase FlgJ [Aquabacterium sp.]
MSLSSPANNAGLSLDLRSLDRLRASGGTDRNGLKEAAKQLESLFMQELMKSMRATTMNSGMTDNAATEMGTGMLDTQMSTQMSGLPGGLGDLILRQLERQMGKVATPTAHAAGAAAAPARAEGAASSGKLSHTENFVKKHQAAAAAAEASTGIPAAHILGQAALESGWGKREIRATDGSNSHNLFGIKADSSWKGKVAEVTTTEYIGGVARKVTAKFRAYASYEESFKDHARLLSQSPRYSQTMAQADSVQGFARGLQKAGYATDPAYADKLTKVINTTLRLQRTVT